MRAISTDAYPQLAAPFEATQTDVRGGVRIVYITGEQCITRLNTVLGVAGWQFRIVEHGMMTEADEIWVLGEMTAWFADEEGPVIRQQFGSQKIKRSRQSNIPLDIGFDFKGATTDALKKCASLLGVALYLSHKETPADQDEARNAIANPVDMRGKQQEKAASATAPKPAVAKPAQAAPAAAAKSATANGPLPAAPPAEAILCDVCQEQLKETQFRDGTVWTPKQLQGYGNRKHGQTLCMNDYRKANEKRAAQAVAEEEVPF